MENKKESSQPKDIEGVRVRTKSSSSNISEDGNTPDGPKRHRTTSQTYMVSSGLTSASPPKFVTLEEIMQAAIGLKDMSLVHQIVVDKDFRLERYEPESNSLEKAVKDNMHKAFWNILREELAEDPANYKQALVLLGNVRQGLFTLLLPQHTKLKQQIADVLDIPLIKQQTEKGTLDFHYYSNYVISLMGRLCAPVRDERIRELQHITDVVDTFKGILETLDLMALDIANFTLEISKPEIIARSVEIERCRFGDFLQIHPDGLANTRDWIINQLEESTENYTIPQKPDEHFNFIRATTKKTVRDAYIQLLEWPDNKNYPETFMLDEARLIELRVQTKKLINMATILLIAVSNVGADLQSIAAFKQTLKNHCAIIFETYKSEKDLDDLLPNIIVQVLKDIQEAQATYKLKELSEDTVKLLTEQLKGVSSSENRIKQLVRLRVKEFFLHIVQSQTADPEKVPGGLSTLQSELLAIAGQFLRLVSHNMTVFCIFYYDIISEALPRPS